MNDLRISIIAFIRLVGLTMTATFDGKAGDTNDGAWSDDPSADRWSVTLRKTGDKRQKMTLPFYQGSGHNGQEPTLASVLQCLAGDAAGVAGEVPFEEWASEYGYDVDSRRAHGIYRGCVKLSHRLERFLDLSNFQALLYQVDADDLTDTGESGITGGRISMTTRTKPPMTDAKLLRDAIKASGLSVNKFAAHIGYAARTVKYWRAQGATLALNRRAQLTLIGVVETAKMDAHLATFPTLAEQPSE